MARQVPERLEPGLYFVATPIGAARDITLRALDILGAADVLAAEDTRTLRHLMDIHGIALGDRPLVAYHDHNGERVRPRLLRDLAEGRSVAYASEAGTPLVADPGYQLARAAIDWTRLGMMARPRVPKTSRATMASSVRPIHSVALVGVYQWIGPSPNSGLTKNWSIG